MLVSWSLPTVGFSLWPCVVLLAVFVPISIWHERNWRRTLAEYAERRREAGAPPGPWPSASLATLMGVQPWLVLFACGLLGAGVGVAVWATLMWPLTPPGFELPINPLDLPFIWSMIVAATAALVAGIAIAVDAARSPWSKVARLVRSAIHTSAERRSQLFAQALEVDPEVPHPAGSPAAAAPEPPAAEVASSGGDATS